MSAYRTRQAAVLLAGAAAIMPVAAMSSTAGNDVPAASAGYFPSDSALTLTRTLRRMLPDGKEVTSRRTYELHITRDGEGFRVDGRQVDCSVEAPPLLEAIAALERARVDTGMFPIQLDASGLITQLGGEVDMVAREKLGQAAANLLGNSRLPDDDRQQAQSFVDQLRNRSSGLTDWPRDLFHPQPGKRSETRKVALPDGSQGQVTVSVEAGQSDASPSGDRLERVVVTELGGSRRITREEWTLAPLRR